MITPKLVVLDDYEGEMNNSPGMLRIRHCAEVTVLNRPISESDGQLLAGADIILALRERTKMDEAFFQSCPNLELILQTGGHAYHIDRQAAADRGVAIALGRRVTQPMVVVPELAFALILGLTRNIYPVQLRMKMGEWPEMIGGSLSGKTLGILGYGRHGRPVARLAEAFGMKVMAWDRKGEYPESAGAAVVRRQLDDLLTEADIVSIHLRLSEESKGLLDEARIRKMKPGALLINTSRGAIIDEAALVKALREGWIAGAGLDVFAVEPLPADSPLRKLPNVLLTPHLGWKALPVLREFVDIAADQLEAWLQCRLPRAELLDPDALDPERKRSGGITGS